MSLIYLKLIRAELQRQNQRRFANAQLADIEEEELEVDTLNVDVKPATSKNVMKALGTYLYPLATNHSRKTPPRPCQNCGSLYHYNRDCVLPVPDSLGVTSSQISSFLFFRLTATHVLSCFFSLSQGEVFYRRIACSILF
jgi:hypothetical protein